MKYDKTQQSARNAERRSQHDRESAVRKVRAFGAMRPFDWATDLGVRRDDVICFSLAASQFDHVILLRHTNVESLGYIGRFGFVPKPIDSKAKTADKDTYVQETCLRSQCAGLVVDPTLLGHDAFNTPARRDKAFYCWEDFSRRSTSDEHVRRVFRRRESIGFFAVDNFPTSPRFGCLMLADKVSGVPDGFTLASPIWQAFKREKMCYVHGDYDLYGLVDVQKTEDTLRRTHGQERHKQIVLMTRERGELNYFPPAFDEKTDFLNSSIGAPMIQHGPQDAFRHESDELYIFTPTGAKYHSVASSDLIKEIYELVFKQDVDA
jgi:hypothetical protein